MLKSVQYWYRIEHSENIVITQSGMFETGSDLEGFSIAFDEHEYCRNTKGTNQVQLICVDYVSAV